MTIAIIGAGIAGAAAARHLADRHRKVCLFDKSRGAGGRMATRRRGELAFDHGAPHASATGGAFARFLQEAIAHGSAARWDMRNSGEVNMVVGLPGMSGLVRYPLSGLDMHAAFEAVAITRGEGGWTLTAKDGRTAGPFEAVLVTIPAPQCAALLEGCHGDFASSAAAAAYDPCWTLMIAADGALKATADAAVDALASEDIAVLVRNGAKPGRDDATLVAHAAAGFSREHLESDAETVCTELCDRVSRRLGITAHLSMAHRWRHARVRRTATTGVAYDADAGLGIAGDWCLGPTAEDAYHSGLALARAVVAAHP